MENEVRLVDANALIEDITAAEENAGMGAVVAGTLRRYVNRRPTIDPESLRPKGRWEYVDDGVLIGNGMHMECSECSVWKIDRQRTPYCPNCGAKMEG